MSSTATCIRPAVQRGVQEAVHPVVQPTRRQLLSAGLFFERLFNLIVRHLPVVYFSTFFLFSLFCFFLACLFLDREILAQHSWSAESFELHMAWWPGLSKSKASQSPREFHRGCKENRWLQGLVVAARKSGSVVDGSRKYLPVEVRTLVQTFASNNKWSNNRVATALISACSFSQGSIEAWSAANTPHVRAIESGSKPVWRVLKGTSYVEFWVKTFCQLVSFYSALLPSGIGSLG